MCEEEVLPKKDRKKRGRKLLRETNRNAWIGDAILHLYIRKTLLEKYKNNYAKIPPYSALVSNDALRRFSGGAATEFESRIYLLWQRGNIKRIEEIVKNLLEFIYKETKESQSCEFIHEYDI